MSSSLADYLNAKYLTKDDSLDKKAKKRKRKEEKAKAKGHALTLVDEDATGWEHARDADNDDDDDGYGRPITVTDRSTAEFRKSKKSTWNTVSNPTPTEDDAAADAIIASTAADIAADEAALLASEAPVLVADESAITEMEQQQMESGAAAGLQTAAQVSAAMKKKRAKELSEFHKSNATDAGKGAETIYRDASGRIINIAMQRAAARRKAEEEEAQKRQQVEMNKGIVQQLAAEDSRQQLRDAKFLKLARHADDEDMNRELMAKDHWNDPALGFIKSKSAGESKAGFPLYKGAFAPNRYNIRPGHRWDGVDRGNGTEAMFFRKSNERRDRVQQEYAWEMDV
ncbi:Pre-mRNA-splicing factor [Drechslerella dactyloides]|uniref:Pre-mRNA-splicing factor n=1 Tax=Drechslerella dactyloides TaxID=74499 RepID=A0AAD6NN18_DREDA|nr:Pre-mRNA-splicing factor [Drechslerella dactyloides]